MEHAPIFTLVVITLLQLCRAQSSSSAPEWYAANDINDTNFSPKPITELFSTETSFSPENPIIVLPPTSPTASNRGVVSSPTPITQYSDPPNVIPLSTEQPSSPPLLDYSNPPSRDTQSPSTQTSTSEAISTTSLPTVTESTSISGNTQAQPNPATSQQPNINTQNVRQNQPPSVQNRLVPQMQPQNIQFLLPAQVPNRNFIPGQPLPPMGQPNYIVVYQQPPQNMPPVNAQVPQQFPAPSITTRPIPRVVTRPAVNNVVGNRPIIQRPQIPNQFFPQPPNTFPPIQTNNQPPNNQSPVNQLPNNPPPNNQQLINQPTINQQPNNRYQTNPALNSLSPNNQYPIIQPQNNLSSNNQNPVPQSPNSLPPNNQYPIGQPPINLPPNNQYPVNQPPNNLQPNNQIPNNVMTYPPYMPPGISTRPPRQRNRINGGRLNRGPNRTQAPNIFPCQGPNNTVLRPATSGAKSQNPVITIRLTPSQGSRAVQQNKPTPTAKPTTLKPKQTSQMNTRNYERCLNSCRDKKDRICASPQKDIQINPETLKGFPSMCHMACHNTFRANPIYGKIANGRCGKLRTRIQTVDKTKIRRDELNKSQYTIISNVPGTVVELAQ